MTKPTTSTQFASHAEEGKYVITNVKNNRKFRDNFFYGTGYYSLESIRKYIVDCVWKSYRYKLADREFGSVIYEHCWDRGTWHPFDTYGGVYSIFAWMSRVALHTITAYLEELGEIKVRRERTAKNTKVLLKKFSPEGCQFFIDEVMDDGECRNLLHDIYVECKGDAEIMRSLHLEAEQYEKVRKDAEELFRFRVINSAYSFEDYVIAENAPRDITVDIDEVYPSCFAYETTPTSKLADVFGVCDSPADVATHVNAFILEVIHHLKWNEECIFVFLQRWEGVPAADVAKAIGRTREWVNTRYSRLRAVFVAFLRYWWYTHC